MTTKISCLFSVFISIIFCDLCSNKSQFPILLVKKRVRDFNWGVHVDITIESQNQAFIPVKRMQTSVFSVQDTAIHINISS